MYVPFGKRVEGIVIEVDREKVSETVFLFSVVLFSFVS